MLSRQQGYRNAPILLLEALLQVCKVCVPFFLFPFALVVHAFAGKDNVSRLFHEADACEHLLVFSLTECPLLDKVSCHIEILVHSVRIDRARHDICLIFFEM